MNPDRTVRVTKCTVPVDPSGSETRENLGEMRYGAFVDMVREGGGRELLTGLWQMPNAAGEFFVQYVLTWVSA